MEICSAQELSVNIMIFLKLFFFFRLPNKLQRKTNFFFPMVALPQKNIQENTYPLKSCSFSGADNNDKDVLKDPTGEIFESGQKDRMVLN